MKKSMKEVEEKVKAYFFRENKIKILKNTVFELKNQTLDIQDKIKDLSSLILTK